MHIDMVLAAIKDEVERAQDNLPEDWDDAANSKNDWIAYVVAYLGRASDKVLKNEKQEEGFNTNMIKASGLIVSALVNR